MVDEVVMPIDTGLPKREGPQWDGGIRSLAEQNFAIVCFGHSAPLQANASSPFERFAKTLEVGSIR